MPDCVYINPKTGAKFFIGGEDSASSLKHLEELEIFHVVNCKGDSGDNYFEEDPRFSYFRFGVAYWHMKAGVKTPEGVLNFFMPVHKFIDDAMDQGKNVMVHCLAGAHRAGTAGVSYLMKMG